MGSVVALTIVFLFGCAGGTSVASEETETEKSILFLVGAVDGEMIPNAQLFLVSAEGVQLIGRTDGLGSIRIARSLLEEGEPHAILICANYFFCGAFRLDEPEFFEASEHFIALAPFTIH